MEKLMFKVENLGLNKLGVKELNEHYKGNIENGFIDVFKLNEIIDTCKKKIYKQSKTFLKKRENNYIGSIGCSQYIQNEKIPGPDFSLQLKHINYKITKIEIIENESNFNFL
jgi:hypothetical protein